MAREPGRPGHRAGVYEVTVSSRSNWPMLMTRKEPSRRISCDPRIDGSHVRAMKGGPKPDRARSTVPEQAPSTI